MIAETWFLMIVDVHNLSDKINEGFSIKIFFLSRPGVQSPLDDLPLNLTKRSLTNSQSPARAVVALRRGGGSKQAQDWFL